MLSVSPPLSAGQSEYYANLAAEDYYLKGGEPPGHWMGKGTASLGLEGQIENGQFLEVFDGHLGNRKLVQNAGLDSRVPGWDLTFSAPKSVSVAWSQADLEVSQEIRAAHQEAVEKALGFLEAEAGCSRVGKLGQQVVKADLVFATFEHGTSRAQEPQLHTHCLLMNASVRQDGSTGAVLMQPIYKHKMAAGAIYRAELAYQLQRRLGFEVEQDAEAKFSFRLKGVSRKLEEHFSTRRKEVEQHLQARGLRGAAASSRMAVFSRSNKENAPRSELVEQWRKVGIQLGFSQQQLEKLIQRAGKPERVGAEMVARLAMTEAIDAITEHQSTFTRADLIRAAAEIGQMEGLSAGLILDLADDALKMDAVSLGVSREKAALKDHPGLAQIRYTTQEILDLEAKLLGQVEAGRDMAKNKPERTVPSALVEWVIAQRPTIKPEQAEAVRHLTTCQDQVRTVTGQAGTGKTYMLAAGCEAWVKSGFEVRGIAPSAKAAKGLEEGAQISSSTIHSWLWALNHGKETLHGRSVVVMDEAGMTDTKIMAAVMEHISQSGASLVLIGDAAQLQAVQQGGSFKAIDERLGHEVRLTDIVRQERESDRQAVRDVATGNARAALEHFQREDQLKIAEDREAAYDRLLKDWLPRGLAGPETQLIFTGTNLDAANLNRLIQEARIRSGCLSRNRQVEFSGQAFYVGDRVLFTRNARAKGIQNGMLGTIEAIQPRLNSMTVRCDDGGHSRTISLREFDHVKLGYAMTTHKGQGTTVERAYVLTHEAMQDRELSYVQMSRAKTETRVYTTEFEAGEQLTDLVRSMERSRQKELALTQQQSFDTQQLSL